VSSPQPPIEGSTTRVLQKDGSRKHLLLFRGIHTPVKRLDTTDVSEGFISVNQLYNSMNDGPVNVTRDFLLVVDARAEEDYRVSHVVASKHHLSVTGDWRQVKRFTLVVLYDHKGLSHTIRESTLSRLLVCAHAAGLGAFVLEGGFEAFQAKYPFLCENEQAETRTYYPSVILDDQLYLGRGDQATSVKVTTDLKVTHIVNISTEHTSNLPNMRYMNVPICDDGAADILSLIPSVILFMVEALGNGGRVLVHCNLGISRSSTLVLAYLMYSRHWTLGLAYKFVRERRPLVHPNTGFMTQLLSLEEMLFGSKITTYEDLHGAK
jgi:serine/threonine/tyrosine-interacting-like protein 1